MYISKLKNILKIEKMDYKIKAWNGKNEEKWNVVLVIIKNKVYSISYYSSRLLVKKSSLKVTYTLQLIQSIV